jgi:hypothetical protein
MEKLADEHVPGRREIGLSELLIELQLTVGRIYLSCTRSDLTSGLGFLDSGPNRYSWLACIIVVTGMDKIQGLSVH